MQENLVIVESPAKAKTIEKFLGSDFLVTSSMGHIRDLEKKDLGLILKIILNQNILSRPTRKKIVSELKKLSKNRKNGLDSIG